METDIEDFLISLRRFYEESGRHDMLWRQPESDGSLDPYKILVSELMLQQTQVVRVAPKFVAFTERFPTVQAMAAASLGDVLGLWSGLGYNRRAKFLWQAAVAITTDFDGHFPRTPADLQKLPGVGPNTAGAIMAYAYNQPVIYLETNIRTVLIHHFFQNELAIPDKTLRAVLKQIVWQLELSEMSPREFYWAMMDYGAYLKQTVGNLNRASSSFVKQSTFHGSRRQVRGQVIRLLTERKYTIDELVKTLSDERAVSVIDDLVSEGLLQKRGQMLSLQ